MCQCDVFVIYCVRVCDVVWHFFVSVCVDLRVQCVFVYCLKVIVCCFMVWFVRVVCLCVMRLRVLRAVHCVMLYGLFLSYLFVWVFC